MVMISVYSGIKKTGGENSKRALLFARGTHEAWHSHTFLGGFGGMLSGARVWKIQGGQLDNKGGEKSQNDGRRKI